MPLQVLPGDKAALVFFKLRPDVVTPQNMLTNVLVSSMLDSPASVLYHSLQKLYAPVLLKVRTRPAFAEIQDFQTLLQHDEIAEYSGRQQH